jgi:hypothetical protein
LRTARQHYWTKKLMTHTRIGPEKRTIKHYESPSLS